MHPLPQTSATRLGHRRHRVLPLLLQGRRTDDDTDIIAGEEESEDTYPLSPDGCFADLEALLRDTFAESLPLQPLCQPDCKGLCPQCGINLNEHPEHKHDTTDIRFAALAGLKEQLERETKDR